MTREEAIDVLNKSIKAGSKVPWLTIVEAVELAIQALSVSLPSDVDEAAEELWAEYEYRESPKGLYSSCYVDGFKAGAEWQKKKDDELLTIAYMDGVADGKAKMMEEAVEGEICGRVYDHINVRFADGICKYLEPKNISHIPADVSKFKVGDKVSIIIVKEE